MEAENEKEASIMARELHANGAPFLSSDDFEKTIFEVSEDKETNVDPQLYEKKYNKLLNGEEL